MKQEYGRDRQSVLTCNPGAGSAGGRSQRTAAAAQPPPAPQPRRCGGGCGPGSPCSPPPTCTAARRPADAAPMRAQACCCCRLVLLLSPRRRKPAARLQQGGWRRAAWLWLRVVARVPAGQDWCRPPRQHPAGAATAPSPAVGRVAAACGERGCWKRRCCGQCSSPLMHQQTTPLQFLRLPAQSCRLRQLRRSMAQQARRRCWAMAMKGRTEDLSGANWGEIPQVSWAGMPLARSQTLVCPAWETACPSGSQS